MAQRRSTSDLRVRRTKERIRNAIRELTLNMPFDEISVQAIAQHAGCQRNTFYDHYTSKYEVLEEMLGELVDEIEAVTTAHFSEMQQHSPGEIPPTFTKLFEVFGRDIPFYRRLFGPEGSSIFTARIVNALEQSGMRHAQYWSNLLPEQTVPNEIAFRFLSAAFVGMLAWWLESDHQYSAEQMGVFLWRMEIRQRPS
ncbi:TetR family transcriptional regulator [Deinococcus yavapaiensis KR-236]|uniref:TetR family transcriptional regulator n=2 Tax=Deinococcus TaxID=1298 RepID=A0A318S3Z5_9DEIO|nr:TetR family transcriptional regulator [Deinococcus yavapaiensis KR-236]